jgi:hypothetical protein
MITEDYRVAILITGQSRTYSVCLDNIRTFFSNPKTEDSVRWVKVDYFLHTWTTNQWTESGSDKIRLHEIPYVKADINEKEVHQKLTTEGYTRVVNIEIEKFNPERIHKAWGPGLYSIYKANLAKLKNEYKEGIVYDVVIKVRFDQIFNPKHLFRYHNFSNSIENRFMYTNSVTARMPNELNSFNLDDVWYFSDSPTMNLIAQTYNYVGQSIGEPAHKKSRLDRMFYPETLLGPGCLNNRFINLINIHGIRVCNQDYRYIIVRKKSLDEGWDPRFDYEKISKNSLEYYSTLKNLI